MMLPDVCLSVCRVHPVGERRVRPAGCGWRVLADRARLGRPGSRLPLRTSVAGLGGGILWRPRAQLVIIIIIIMYKPGCLYCTRRNAAADTWLGLLT